MIRFNKTFRWYYEKDFIDYFNPRTKKIEIIRLNNIGILCDMIEKESIDFDFSKSKILNKMIEIGLLEVVHE